MSITRKHENTRSGARMLLHAIKKAIDVLQKKAGKMNEDATDILDAIDNEEKKS